MHGDGGLFVYPSVSCHESLKELIDRSGLTADVGHAGHVHSGSDPGVSLFGDAGLTLIFATLVLHYIVPSVGDQLFKRGVDES